MFQRACQNFHKKYEHSQSNFVNFPTLGKKRFKKTSEIITSILSPDVCLRNLQETYSSFVGGPFFLRGAIFLISREPFYVVCGWAEGAFFLRVHFYSAIKGG